MWFEALTGFPEQPASNVRRQLAVRDGWLASLANGKRWHAGTLETPSLAELRRRVDSLPAETGCLRLRECVADVQVLHADPTNAGALFQVASQFNLLEPRIRGWTARSVRFWGCRARRSEEGERAIPTSCNAAMRRQNRAICIVATLTPWVIWPCD